LAQTRRRRRKQSNNDSCFCYSEVKNIVQNGKMLKKSVKLYSLIVLSNILLFTSSCNNNGRGNLTVIKAHFTNENWFPCFVLNNDKRLSIDNIRVYKNGKLKEYQGCGSEGLYSTRFSSNSDYLKEDKIFKELKLSKQGNVLFYFNEEFTIERISKDSTFAKSKNQEDYLIFIEKTP
jgi:hypothetical protein